jgi:hypothetical protein
MLDHVIDSVREFKNTQIIDRTSGIYLRITTYILGYTVAISTTAKTPKMQKKSVVDFN